MSEEGILLYVRELSVSIKDWVKLLALATELGHLRSTLSSMASDRVRQELLVAAGWLHHRRRRLLKKICCVTEQHRDELLNTCRQKLTQYR